MREANRTSAVWVTAACLAWTLGCAERPKTGGEKVEISRSFMRLSEPTLTAESHPPLAFVADVVRNELPASQFSLSVPDGQRLRLIDDALEFMDASGTPVLRLNVPRDYDSQLVISRLEVEGCSVDRNPAPPWGRALPLPLTTCTLYVLWDRLPAPATRDAIVEASWEFPWCLSEPRANHALVELGDGRLLAVTGNTRLNTLSTSSEIYDPATDTWSATGALNTASQAAAVALDNGLVVAFGTTMSTAPGEVWDPATGSWTSLGRAPNGRREFGLARLPGNRVLLAGGSELNLGSTTEIVPAYTSRVLDLSAGPPGTWTTAADMPVNVLGPWPIELDNGDVLFVGGRSAGVTAATSVLRYRPSSDSWTNQSLLYASDRHSLSLLPDGHVALVGGWSSSAAATVQLIDPVELSRPVAGTALRRRRYDHTTSVLPEGTLVAIGGFDDTGTDPNVSGDLGSIEYLVPGASSWSTAPSLGEPRNGHRAVVLPNRDILVVGGRHYVRVNSNWVERYSRGCVRVTLEPAQGDPTPGCFTDADCAGQPCVDGVCCDRACHGSCEACSRYKKGYGADGVCEPIAAGRDPEWECAQENVSTCGQTGFCDGTGACAKYAESTLCQASTCTGTTWTLDAKCHGGACVSDGVLQCSGGFQCQAGACATYCSDDTACAPGHSCKAGACIGGGGAAGSNAGGAANGGTSGGGAVSGGADTAGSAGSATDLPPQDGCTCRASGGNGGSRLGSSLLAALTLLGVTARRRKRGRD